MEIRSLDDPSNRLSFKIDEQGDIYVTIIHNGDSFRDSRIETVRIGGPASGHQVPARIHALLRALAVEFGKYDNIQFETDAALAEDLTEERKHLEGEISAAEKVSARFAGKDVLLRTLRNRLEALNTQYDAVVARNQAFPDMSPKCFVSLCNYKWEQLRFHEKEHNRMFEDLQHLAQKYAEQAFEKSPYKVGQPYTDAAGKLWYVSGAYASYIHPDGHVYLTFNTAKKDGTMSKVSGFGNGMPDLRIK